MAAEIRARFVGTDVRLLEVSGGLFEVAVNGQLIFSKQALGRHAEPGEVVALIEAQREQR